MTSGAPGCRTVWRFWRVALAPSSHVVWLC
nr:MAG TPA: hypothetical protein [Caudoviricetes sp.]